MIRARIELVLAVLFGIATVATIIWPTWIESLTTLEPDKGSGEAEWWLIIVLGSVAVAASLLARRDFRALKPQRGSAGAG